METTVLSALAARSADAVVVVEADESISFYSQAAAALLELPFPARRLEFSELWSAHEFVHRDGTLRSFAGDPLRESLRGGRPVSEEMVELRPDGLLRAFWIGSVPFSDHEGRLLGSAVYLSLLSEALPGETHPAPVETGRVLVAEPDESMREAIRVGLVHEGFTVATVGDGRAALRRALAERYDAVVLDAELPEISGRETCQLLRVESDLPIILLASAEGVIERLLALEVGADDCLARPFATEELVARVRAILRRRRLDAPVVATTVRKLGDLLIDLVSHQLFVDGNLVELTPSEFKVLALLSSEPDRLFTRREIMENLWDSTYVGDERVCDTHISNLRRKIERNPAHPERIVTVRGAGYKLAFQ